MFERLSLLFYFREKKEREAKEEEIVETLRDVSGRVQESLRRTKRDREKTEEQMVMLVEQVIEKLKREMIEMNIWSSMISKHKHILTIL